jgi:2-polyprenyl-3-methyl-5-hydroxy-6-metoxy-1,4-benzoquinol methylase
VGRISGRSTKPLQYYKGILIQADLGLHEQIVAAVAPRLRGRAKVLDFGCGEGALSQRFSDLGFDVCSVDSNEGSFKASTPFIGLDFNDAAAVSDLLRLHRGAFDLVLGVEVIEHVENPWQYVRDLASMAADGGLIVITTPNVTSWHSRLGFLHTGRLHQFGDADRSYGHINPIAEDELRLIVERSGLDVVEILPGGTLPRLWLAGGARMVMRNVVGYVATFWMRGMWDGWCLIAVLRKPSPT